MTDHPPDSWLHYPLPPLVRMGKPIRMDQYHLYEVGGNDLLETYTIVEGQRFDLNSVSKPPGFPFGYEWRHINADGNLVRILTARWVET